MPNPPNKFKTSSEQICDIISKYKDHQSVRMLGKEYGVDHGVISRVLRENGIIVRTKSESAAYTWKNHDFPTIKMAEAEKKRRGSKLTAEHRRKQSESLRVYYAAHAKETIIRNDGYCSTYMPTHKMAFGGRVLQHRLIMERFLGRELDSNEIVHHINEDRTDNRIENMTIMTRAEHALLHGSLAKFNKKRREEKNEHDNVYRRIDEGSRAENDTERNTSMLVPGGGFVEDER